MNVNERFDVAPAKVEELRARIARLGIDVAAIDEQFVRGGGRGGQKINKTNNCVLLRYAPLDLTVRCQRERRRTVNRFIALRELVDQIEMRVSPGTSERLREAEQKIARSARAHRKARAKHGPKTEDGTAEDSEDAEKK